MIQNSDRPRPSPTVPHDHRDRPPSPIGGRSLVDADRPGKTGDGQAGTDEPWMDSASCASADPELWFPVKGGVASHDTTYTARGICAACPVQVQCLTYALERPHLEGIWGGMTDRDRMRARRSGRTAA